MTYIPDLIRQRLVDLATNHLKSHPAILSRLKIEMESYSGITIWMTSVVSNMEFGTASAIGQMQHIDEKLLDRIDSWTKGQPEFLRVRAPFTQANTAKPVTEVAESASASNSTTPDPERRLARLRELGGNATYKRGEWKIVGISVLVASEKSESRKRSDEKTIRADLKEAAENELEAKRANAFTGLGQK